MVWKSSVIMINHSPFWSAIFQSLLWISPPFLLCRVTSFYDKFDSSCAFSNSPEGVCLTFLPLSPPGPRIYTGEEWPHSCAPTHTLTHTSHSLSFLTSDITLCGDPEQRCTHNLWVHVCVRAWLDACPCVCVCVYKLELGSTSSAYFNILLPLKKAWEPKYLL